VQARAVLSLLLEAGNAQAEHDEALAKVSSAAGEAVRQAEAQRADFQARYADLESRMEAAGIQAGRDKVGQAETQAAELQKKLDNAERAYARLRAAANEALPYLKPFLSPPANAEAVAKQLSGLVNG
jgi:hypothetical protein